jgi:hypothetical protein
MTPRLILAGIVTAALAGPAGAAEIISTFNQEENGAVSVYFAPDDCGGECFTAGFICTEFKSLEVEISDFSNEEMADWLRLNGVTAAAEADGELMTLMPISINMNLMNGSWDGRFQGDGGHAWMETAARARTIVLTAGNRRIDLPVREGDLANLNLLAMACQY